MLISSGFASSVFAGALTDCFDKKKTLICCDLAAAVCTTAVLVLFISGNLEVWHLYVLNAILVSSGVCCASLRGKS